MKKGPIMIKLPLAIAILGALTTVGCAHSEGGGGAASAVIRDAGGATVATATVREQAGLAVRVDASGLRPGISAAHLHAVGRCEPADFATAGPHWNPTGRQPGRAKPMGAQLGALPNLPVGADGRGTLEFGVDQARLRGDANALFDSDGAAIVIHANPDDDRTDPSGNSGGRIACGVLG
jgi:Cu-Zn family superoxide dismutase